MPTEPEEDVQASAVKYLRRHSMKEDEWKFTRLGQLHPELEEKLKLEPEERVVVSSLVAPESWYVFTTFRLIAGLNGVVQSVETMNIGDNDFNNFKGYRPGQGPGAESTEIATITTRNDDTKVQFEYETLYASMAPIYACKFFIRRAKRLRAENLPAYAARTDA
jgi:hypothetical protein